MAGNGLNPNNNLIKQQDIEDLWYSTIGTKMSRGKVNLTTNEEFKKAKLAGISKYIREVYNKAIPIVFEQPIYLKPHQNLHVVSYANAHFFDKSNPESNYDNEIFLKDLLDKDPNDYTACFFAGNLIGSEWKISDLNNAPIDEDGDILFWGINKRIERLVNKIKFAIKNGANVIYLMDGREEHLARQKLNVDILSEVLKEKFNDDLLALLVEKLQQDSDIVDKNVKLYYVKGVKKVFNILRENENGTNSHYTISMHTNLKTTSNQLKGNLKAAEKQHDGLAAADMIFIQGENVYGSIDSRHIVIFTGRSTYQKSIKGNLPGIAPDTRASCTLLLGEPHYIEKTWTMQINNPKTYSKERERAELQDKLDYLILSCRKKLSDKHKEIASTLSSNSKYEQNYKE